MDYSRVTDKLINNNIINGITSNRSKLNNLNEELSSGTKVRTPSDDPGNANIILSNNKSLSLIDTYLNNIDSANSELDISNKSILSVTDHVQRAAELATQASNATLSSQELSGIAAEVDQIISTVMDTANSKYGDKYVFGGLVTDSPPYTTDTDGNIIYNGTLSTGNYQRKAEISENVTVDMNVAGEAVFGQDDASANPPQQYGLFNTLKSLSQELKNNPPNYDNIRSKIDLLNNDSKTLLNAQAQLGGVQQKLDMTKNKLLDNQVIFTKSKSTAGDIDLATVISQINYQNIVLQASLQSSVKITQPSLLNYL